MTPSYYAIGLELDIFNKLFDQEPVSLTFKEKSCLISQPNTLEEPEVG